MDTNYQGKVKNAGRANAITAEQDALAEARRDVRKKWDFEGYDEYLETGQDQFGQPLWTNIDNRNQGVSIPHLLTSLPSSFCLYKPENTFWDQKKLVEKARAGKALYTLKRDGIAHWVVKDYYGEIKIYSRRSRPWSDREAPTEMLDGSLDYSTAKPWALRFPHLVEAVKRLNLPNGTMMAAELVVTGANGRDAFPIASGYTKGHTERSLADQQQYGLPMFYWWDLPFLGGMNLLERTVQERYNVITSFWSNAVDVAKQIQPIQYMRFPTPEDAVIYAKKHGFEGFVVVDPEAIYGDRGWNLKGKPDRPSTCAKLKPDFEDDFVAFWDPDNGVGEWGTGKHERNKTVELPDGSRVVHGGVGSIMLYQYNDKKELIPISKVSSGMDYAFQAQLRKEHFPFVCEVQYKERTYISDGDKTNALRHPTFLRLRPDKKMEECVNARL